MIFRQMAVAQPQGIEWQSLKRTDRQQVDVGRQRAGQGGQQPSAQSLQLDVLRSGLRPRNGCTQAEQRLPAGKTRVKPEHTDLAACREQRKDLGLAEVISQQRR